MSCSIYSMAFTNALLSLPGLLITKKESTWQGRSKEKALAEKFLIGSIAGSISYIGYAAITGSILSTPAVIGVITGVGAGTATFCKAQTCPNYFVDNYTIIPTSTILGTLISGVACGFLEQVAALLSKSK